VFQHAIADIPRSNSGYSMRDPYLAVVSQDTGREIFNGRFALTGVELRVPVGAYVIKAWSLEYPDDISYDQDGNKSPPQARYHCNDLIVRVARDAPIEVVATRRGDDCVTALGAAPWTIVFGRGEVASEAARSWWIATHVPQKVSPAMTVQLPREAMAAYLHRAPRRNGAFGELRVSASGSVPVDGARVCSLFESGCRELLAYTSCAITFTAEDLAEVAASGRQLSILVPEVAARLRDAPPQCARIDLYP
jgi:hypothetical protein